jgi:hypothetical protein
MKASDAPATRTTTTAPTPWTSPSSGPSSGPRLPAEFREARKAVAPAAVSELAVGERADVSWITIEAIDRQPDVPVAKGMDESHFALNPLVTLDYNCWPPPVGRMRPPGYGACRSMMPPPFRPVRHTRPGCGGPPVPRNPDAVDACHARPPGLTGNSRNRRAAPGRHP